MEDDLKILSIEYRITHLSNFKPNRKQKKAWNEDELHWKMTLKQNLYNTNYTAQLTLNFAQILNNFVTRAQSENWEL